MIRDYNTWGSILGSPYFGTEVLQNYQTCWSLVGNKEICWGSIATMEGRMETTVV